MHSLRPMTIADYDAVMHLMANTPGVSVRDADSRAATLRYLERNPGLSFVAEVNGMIQGCALCGHDGRRGYLQHVIVSPDHRRQGIAGQLVDQCLQGLEALGIEKCHLDVFKTNQAAAGYWAKHGWQLRDDIDRFSITRSGNEDA
jgi:ribosomal protein S18 acetylase RimI-like enzyme